MAWVILVSDLQIPWHHRKACDVLLNMIADKQRHIDMVFQVGDFYEFQSVSRWVSGTLAEDGRSLQRELKAAEILLEGFASAFPATKYRIRGNHDDRLDKYLTTTAKGLRGLDVLEYDTFTEAKRFGWETVAQPFTLAPKTQAVHGLCVRSKSGYTAHAHLDRMDSNVIHGHTHRAGLIYKTIGSNTRFAMEVGCLADRKMAPYGVGGLFDWQLAFGALYVDGSDVFPVLVEMKSDGSFFFDGKRYRP